MGDDEIETIKWIAGDDSVVAQQKRLPRQVMVNQPFFPSRHTITQKQWIAMIGDDSSEWEDTGHAIELSPDQVPFNLDENGDDSIQYVSWDLAQGFIDRLNEKENTDKYCLPTGAEWDTGRAKTAGALSYADNLERVQDRYAENSRGVESESPKAAPCTWRGQRSGACLHGG
jgi:formylglycine-generating enzyme required for sulfatase activity